jgi:RNA polymerase sigma factor (sigma-70 family)
LNKPIRQDGDEAELIERAKAGDTKAFGILVERYQRRVVGVAMAVVHDQEDALELAQESFVRAFENIGKFESRSSFSTWLYRIAANIRRCAVNRPNPKSSGCRASSAIRSRKRSAAKWLSASRMRSDS